MKIEICKRYIQILGIISVLSFSNFVFAETVVHNERVIQQDIQKKQEIAKAEQEKRKKEELENRKAEEEKKRKEELEQKRIQEEKRKKEELERKKAQDEKQRLERENKEKAEKRRLEELYNEQTPTEKQEKQVQSKISPKEKPQNNKIIQNQKSSAQMSTFDSNKSQIQTMYWEVPLSPTATLPSKQEKIKKICDRVNAKYDEMKNITYYSPKRISPDPIALYPYIEINHTNNTLRLVYKSTYIGTHSFSANYGIGVQMGDARWIFYHTVIVRADNNLYEIRYNLQRQHREVISESPMIQGGIFGYSGSTSVYEGYTEIMDQNAFEIFKAVANAKEVKMRFAGDNRQIDKKMSKKLKEIHEEIWKIFNILQNE